MKKLRLRWGALWKDVLRDSKSQSIKHLCPPSAPPPADGSGCSPLVTAVFSEVCWTGQSLHRCMLWDQVKDREKLLVSHQTVKHMTNSNLSLLHCPVSPPFFLMPLSLPPLFLITLLPLFFRLGWQDKRSGIAAYVPPLSPQILTLHTLHHHGRCFPISWFQAF